MVYKPGDRLLAADANRVTQLAEPPLQGRGLAEFNQMTPLVANQTFDEVVIVPVQSMSKFNIMRGSSLAGYDSVKKRAKFNISNLQSEGVTDGSNCFYFTNGNQALAAGGLGWGTILREGSFYFIAAEAGTVGYCGVNIGESIIKSGYPGFISMGTQVIDGIDCAYVTPIPMQSYYLKTISSISGGSNGLAYMKVPGAGGWSVSTRQVRIWNPATGPVGANKDVTTSYVNGRLTIVVEDCS